MRRLANVFLVLASLAASSPSLGTQPPAAWQSSSGPPTSMIVRANDGHECNHCNDLDCSCGNGTGSWLDNTEVMLGGDSYAAIGEFPAGGWNNNFGLVTGFNTGFGIGDLPIRGQFGATYGAYDLKGRGSGAEADSLEEQIHLTAGIYRRAALDLGQRISWGLAIDGFLADNWGTDSNEVELSQLRGIGGWALNECNEFGMWGTLNTSSDVVPIGGRAPFPSNIRAMKQANAYWKHNWEFGADTMVYLGAMDSADVGDWVFGFTGRAPLNHRTSLYGGFNYVTPSVNTGAVGDTEDAWNVNFGIVFYLGGNSVSPTVGGNSGLPLLPVANNGSFLITD